MNLSHQAQSPNAVPVGERIAFADKLDTRFIPIGEPLPVMRPGEIDKLVRLGLVKLPERANTRKQNE